ncbi:chitinase 2-like [Dendrobium catenatum]|uniref:Chitinase 2 n=1 Tax=Dendrobium catenatum TaxID=906689 RepID=A0A2I0WIP1_9ASPA|nr:chitinase 2-like [Dendrobium catenatum]PKU75530.1 Chitinase 2 [Dendrobium catenatum]
MASTMLFSFFFFQLVLLLLISLPPPSSAAALAPKNSELFREYIGAEFNGIKFSDVPINPSVDFHFILSFAIDYTTDGGSSTNGHFNVFWDSNNLTPDEVRAIKTRHSNVKVAVSLGGGSVGNGSPVYFNPSSVDSWVNNAVTSLTAIIQRYHLDGVDIDYEQFSADSETFADCIGKLITTLKNNGVISFASIAPFAEEDVQKHYISLWKKYGEYIDYVNFQFYAYDSSTTVSQFLSYFETQRGNYEGGRVLVSFGTDPLSGGLKPDKGFFTACKSLKKQGKLQGIFVWSADDSKSNGFKYEKTSQYMLTDTSP